MSPTRRPTHRATKATRSPRILLSSTKPCSQCSKNSPGTLISARSAPKCSVPSASPLRRRLLERGLDRRLDGLQGVVPGPDAAPGHLAVAADHQEGRDAGDVVGLQRVLLVVQQAGE